MADPLVLQEICAKKGHQRDAKDRCMRCKLHLRAKPKVAPYLNYTDNHMDTSTIYNGWSQNIGSTINANYYNDLRTGLTAQNPNAYIQVTGLAD